MWRRQSNKTADPEKRISVRKKRAIKYGRKTVRIQVARHEDFTISEDLLCSKSNFFRKELQPKRKPFDEDTECAICTEKLEPGVNELTHCTTRCGNNFHYSCIERWKAEKRKARQPVQCPFCRQDWTNDSEVITLHRYPDIKANAFSMFIEWLYHRRIAVEDDSDDEEAPEVDIHELVEAYVLGLKLQSSTFCRDVIEGLLEISKEACQYPDSAGLCLAYDKTAKGSVLRLVLVELYAHATEADWFDEEEEEVDNTYPREFLQDLTTALLKKHPGNETWDLAWMKAKYVTEEAIAHEKLDIDESDKEKSNGDEDEEMGEGDAVIVLD